MGRGAGGRGTGRERALGRAVPAAVLAGGLLLTAPLAAAAGSGEDVLRPGETLAPGQALLAPGGAQTLVVQPDGSVGLYGLDGVARWSTGTGVPGSSLTTTDGGDVVLAAPDGTVVWSTATVAAGAVLRVQDDGEVVVVDGGGAVHWSAGTALEPSSLRAPARLASGATLASPDGRHLLVVDEGGDVRLLGPDGRARWSTATRGEGVGLELRADGNLVVADEDGERLWRSRTAGQDATTLTLQDDGNLVLARDDGSVVWSSGTPVGPSLLAPGGSMAAPASLGSPSGHVRVDVRDGRLVVASDGEPVWASDQDVPGVQLRVGEDGDLVLLDAAGAPVWRTGTAGQPGAALVVEDQAVLLRAADGATLWQVAVPERLAAAGAPPTRCEDVDGPVAEDATVVTRAGIRVHPCLADALDAMLAAAADDGVVLHGGGWRSAEQQIALRRAHCGSSPEAVHEVPAGACRPSTARPGTSRHERGLAVDLTQGGRSLTTSSTGYAWLVEHAHAYGLENLPGEPWHWSVDGR